MVLISLAKIQSPYNKAIKYLLSQCYAQCKTKDYLNCEGLQFYCAIKIVDVSVETLFNDKEFSIEVLSDTMFNIFGSSC